MFPQPVHLDLHHRRTPRTTALIVAATGCLLAGIGTPTASIAATAEPLRVRFYTPCTIDSSSLPHTADAAAHWLATCYQTSQLPHTADAVGGWLADG